ncbi:MAG: hypothetical protein RLZZ53_1293 [Acidobacteriota bacterium]
MNHLTIVLVLALVAQAASAPSDTTLAIAGRANATPWVAASGATVAVAWTVVTEGRNGDVYVAMSGDGGATFATPVRVNTMAGEARINGELAPRVTIFERRGQAPIVSVTWNAKDGLMQVKAARSTDGGKTFAAPTALQAAGAPADRGWQASAFDGKGTLHSFWLDHRGMAGGDRAAMSGDHDGVATAQRSSLYYRADGGAERELLKGVCYCCKTAMAIGAKGEIYAAWRHVFAGNMRDMGFTMSRDGGKTFSPLLRVNQDGWSIHGCPDDGPAMAVDAKGTIHLAWPTVQNEQGGILYATSPDGVAFSTPMRVKTLGGPKPSHPQVAVDATGRVMVAWDESANGVRTAAITTPGGSGAPVVLGRATTYPMLAATNAGFIAAWTSGPADRSVINVRRIR